MVGDDVVDLDDEPANKVVRFKSQQTEPGPKRVVRIETQETEPGRKRVVRVRHVEECTATRSLCC